MNPALLGGARCRFTSFTSSIYLPQPIEFTYFTMVFIPKINLSKENRYMIIYIHTHIYIYIHISYIIYHIPIFDHLFSIDCIDLSSVIMIVYIYIYTYIIYIYISGNMTYIRLYPINTMKSNDFP